MNARGLLILGGLTALAVLLLLWLGRDDGPGREPGVGERVLPGLAAVINEIDALDLVGPDGATVVRLRRERERWRVREHEDYEADFERVHDLLRDLAELRRAEARTTNPDHFARLGVTDPGQPGAEGLRLEFPGSDLPGVLIGHPDPSGRGVFVRRADEDRVWVADRRPDLPDRSLEWVERSVMDIPPEELAEIIIRHPDGETVRLRSAGPDQDQFVLVDVPEGRQAGPAWTRSAVANGMARLRLEEVRRHRPPLPEDSVRVLFTTHDGLNFVASLFRDEDGPWMHFTVGVSDPVEDSPEGGPQGAVAGEDLPPRLLDAVAVDARLSPWEFRVSERRYEDLSRRLDDLLAESEA